MKVQINYIYKKITTSIITNTESGYWYTTLTN